MRFFVFAWSFYGSWQKRLSGKQYNSPSGHNELVDCHKKWVLAQKVYSKLCAICFCHKKRVASSAEEVKDDNTDNVIVNSSDEGGDVAEPAIIKQVKDHRYSRNYKESSNAIN